MYCIKIARNVVNRKSRFDTSLSLVLNLPKRLFTIFLFTVSLLNLAFLGRLFLTVLRFDLFAALLWCGSTGAFTRCTRNLFLQDDISIRQMPQDLLNLLIDLITAVSRDWGEFGRGVDLWTAGEDDLDYPPGGD